MQQMMMADGGVDDDAADGGFGDDAADGDDDTIGVMVVRGIDGCQDGIDAAVGASSDVVVVDLPSSFGDHEYEYDDDDDKMIR